MHKSRLFLLVIAAWFGILTGLLESFAFLRFPHLENPDLPWIAVLFASAVFITIGALLAAAVRPSRGAVTLVSFGFALIMFYDVATVGVLDHGARLIWRAIALALSLVVAGLAWKFQAAFSGFLRRSLLWLAVLAVALTGIPPVLRMYREGQAVNAARPGEGAPNVLVVIVDTLRADHLSTYGYGRETSPRVTEFASHGVLFRNAISAASWTLPSHASIMTARLPHEHGADRPDRYLDERFPTIAEAFSSRGYRTAAFSANWWLFSRRLGFGRGFDHFQDFNSIPSAVVQTNLGQRIRNALLKIAPSIAPLGRSRADSINRNILNWVDLNHEPFFIVANYMDVHEPYLPPLNCFHQFSKLKRPAGEVFLGNPRKNELSPAEVQNEMDAYDASIRCMDTEFASLMDGLRQRGLLSNTVVVLTSDHGEEFNEHGLMSHESTLYREVLHVPLIMVGPGVPAGLQVDRPVSLTNLPDTLLAVSGADGTKFPGIPLNLAWSNLHDTAWPDPVAELAQLPTDPKAPNYYSPLQSVVTADWQLITGGKKVQELYRCPEDQLELHDLAGDKQNEVVAATLRDELQRAESGQLAVSADAQPQTGPAAPSRRKLASPTPAAHDKNSERERNNEYLKALGYIPD